MEAIQPPLLPAKRSLKGKIKCWLGLHHYNLAFIYPAFYKPIGGSQYTCFSVRKADCFTDISNRAYVCVECGHRKLNLDESYLTLKDIALLTAWVESRVNQDRVIDVIKTKGYA